MKLADLLLFIFAVSWSDVQAQQITVSDSSRAKNVCVELLGQGLLHTVNYETRFSKKRTGLGVRIGIGYLADNRTHSTIVPISLNYLIGKVKVFWNLV